MDELAKPIVVPVCFAYDGRFVYSPIDKKPKSVRTSELKRVRNIIHNPHVSLVIDEYFENWAKLYYIMIRGRAELIYKGDEYINALRILSEKYDQYAQMDLEHLGFPVIKIEPEKIISWGDL